MEDDALADVPAILPARMINEYVYFPRFFTWRTSVARRARTTTRSKASGCIVASIEEAARGGAGPTRVNLI